MSNGFMKAGWGHYSFFALGPWAVIMYNLWYLAEMIAEH